MNVSRFSFLLHQPEKTEAGQVDALERVIDQYPYFQPARALHLKALKSENSFAYNDALKCTAAHTKDRSILFDFITSPIFAQNAVANKITQGNREEVAGMQVEDLEEVVVKDNKTVFDFNQVDAQAAMDPKLFSPKEAKQPKETEAPENPADTSEKLSVEQPAPDVEEKLELGRPLEFNRQETHSFSEWLKLSGTYQPIDRSAEAESSEETEEKTPAPSPAPAPVEEDKGVKKMLAFEDKISLIDRFIENNPKIPKVSDQAPKGNLANEGAPERSALMTETLARVYLEQKKYKKAIQAYKILSLKYPEKSALFADQIKAIRKLKDSNK